MTSALKFLYLLLALCASVLVQGSFVCSYKSLLSLKGGNATKSSNNEATKTQDSKPRRSKRKRIKSKLNKWLQVFSKLDKDDKRVLTYYGMMLAG